MLVRSAFSSCGCQGYKVWALTYTLQYENIASKRLEAEIEYACATFEEEEEDNDADSAGPATSQINSMDQAMLGQP